MPACGAAVALEVVEKVLIVRSVTREFIVVKAPTGGAQLRVEPAGFGVLQLKAVLGELQPAGGPP